jgi:hypothetical protein
VLRKHPIILRRYNTTNVPGKLIRFARHTIAGALILLFGPSPLVFLLGASVSSEPECTMACCRGKHHARHCTGQDDEQDSSTLQLRAAVDCATNCSSAALAPSSSVQKSILARSTSFALPQLANERVRITPVPRLITTSDPLLQQRPPPVSL